MFRKTGAIEFWTVSTFWSEKTAATKFLGTDSEGSEPARSMYHKSFFPPRVPDRRVLPFLATVAVCFSKLTVHPASHSGPKPNNEP